jgi:hypothetical protein
VELSTREADNATSSRSGRYGSTETGSNLEEFGRELIDVDISCKNEFMLYLIVDIIFLTRMSTGL